MNVNDCADTFRLYSNSAAARRATAHGMRSKLQIMWSRKLFTIELFSTWCSVSALGMAVQFYIVLDYFISTHSRTTSPAPRHFLCRPVSSKCSALPLPCAFLIDAGTFGSQRSVSESPQRPGIGSSITCAVYSFSDAPAPAVPSPSHHYLCTTSEHTIGSRIGQFWFIVFF